MSDWNDERQHRDRDPRGRLLLGRSGPAAPPGWNHLQPGRIHRWAERQPDLQEPSRSRRGGRDRLRPRAHLLPGHPRVLLPDPRPDDQGPPGQRHRLQLPLRDLLHERRAAPGRRGHDRRRRGLRPLARQGRDRGQRGRPLLGGRARTPGLPRCATRTATPATSRGRAGSCRTARPPARAVVKGARRSSPGRRQLGAPRLATPSARVRRPGPWPRALARAGATDRADIRAGCSARC